MDDSIETMISNIVTFDEDDDEDFEAVWTASMLLLVKKELLDFEIKPPRHPKHLQEIISLPLTVVGKNATAPSTQPSQRGEGQGPQSAFEREPSSSLSAGQEAVLAIIGENGGAVDSEVVLDALLAGRRDGEDEETMWKSGRAVEAARSIGELLQQQRIARKLHGDRVLLLTPSEARVRLDGGANALPWSSLSRSEVRREELFAFANQIFVMVQVGGSNTLDAPLFPLELRPFRPIAYNLFFLFFFLPVLAFCSLF